MNSLDDLRSTLHDHAHDLDGLDPVSRSAGIHARVAEQRRRRNAVRGGVAVAAVAAVVGGVAFTDLGSGPTPDPAGASGAPKSFTALGWTYALANAVESDESSQTVSLSASDRPYLLSWATDGEGQDVTVTSESADLWHSSAADWADYVVVPAGADQEVTVSAGENVTGVAVATYEIDPSKVPAGQGSDRADAFHFREKVADRVLVEAAVAEGRNEVSFDYAASGQKMTLIHSCSGIPKGAWVRVTVDGPDDTTVTADSCDGTGFDQGGSSSFSRSFFPSGGSSEGTVRMWVSRSESDLTPVPDSELTDTVLGVALYSASDLPQVWGTDVAERLESGGHTWQLVDNVEVEEGVPFRLDSLEDVGRQDGPWLVQTVHDATGDDRVSLAVTADGDGLDLGALSDGIGVVVMGDAVIPPTTQALTLEVTAGADVVSRQGFVLYRAVD